MVKSYLKEKVIPIITGVIITFLVAWLQITDVKLIRSVISRLEHVAYDYRYLTTLEFKKHRPSPVAIIDIDEKSLHAEGRWPWPREKVAELVDKLFEAGVVVIAFDVLFTEEQENIAEAILSHDIFAEDRKKITDDIYQKLIDEYNHDKKLADSFENGDVVLGLLLHNDGEASIGQPPEPLMTLSERHQKKLTVQKIKFYTANVPKLQDVAVTAGFTTSIRDTDGVVRKAPLVLRHEDKIYPSLSLATAKTFLLSDNLTLDIHEVGSLDAIEAVKLDNIYIPTDAQGKVLIPFRGERGYFPYISATDVLNGKVPANQLEGNVVFVGTSALGLADLHSTAVQAVYPGVEVHASVLAGILDQNFPMQPAWAKGVNFVWLLTVGLILSVLFAFIGPALIAIIGILVTIAEISLNVWVWLEYGFVLDIILPLMLVTFLMISNLGYGFIFENRRKKQITTMFGQYVSSDLVDEMSKDPSSYNFEGRSQEMTVLFADIRNFTSISENLSAKDLKDLLNRYFEPMTEIIFNTSGTIDKYVGDMIMAFWGAPRPDPFQAQHGIEAAFRMQEKTLQLQQEFKELGLPEINIGIGVNTGVMNVGDMGSKYRRAYTVLGDNVNLASRLEASTKFYGAEILVGQRTFTQTSGIVCRRVDIVRVKGKKEAVAVYEPICRERDITEEIATEIALYEEGIFYYSSRDWEEAEQIFNELIKAHPERKLYHIYLERVRDFKANPPPIDWDGAYTRDSK